ncbi:MAG TPA: HU family DNA-binding protein [Streptosporangiaceae bacterium]
MNRSELVAAVAAKVGSDQAQARRHVDAVFDAIMSSVVDGERVVVTGFGTFDRVTRPARTVRNPRTGQPIEVASTQAPRFSVGRTFKETVSGVPGPARLSAAKPAVKTATKVSAKVDADETANGKKKKKKKDVLVANGTKKAKAAKSAKKKAARKGK